MTTTRPTRLALGCTLIALLASCASTAGGPKTGDISFRLTWTGQADLDLYVESPRAERVDFVKRTVPSGGTLDVDCNVRENMCPAPMENIFWPRGAAPFGEYSYVVNVALADGMKPGDAYKLEVRIGNKVVRQHTGTTASLVDSMFKSSIAFDRRR